MKSSQFALRMCLVIALTMAFTALCQAQDREKFVISATAGGVNSIAGKVVIKHAGESERLLGDRDNLTSGDVVSTGAGGQVEVLLNPGSYLRVGENSEFELTDNSLGHLRVKLTKGNAIVEATGFDETDVRIAFVTPHGRFVIVQRGVYRINAQADSTEVLVRKGRVLLGESPPQVVKNGKRIILTKGSILTAKIEKSDQDEFDRWSKQRAQLLARANEQLASRAFNSFLAGTTIWNTAFSRWNLGLWAFSPISNCFTFMPFYYGWSSPYGHYYGSYYYFNDYYPRRGCCDDRVTVRDPSIRNPNPTGPGSPGVPSGGSVTWPSSGPNAPQTPTTSPAGARDPEAGGRRVNKIPDPND